MFASMKSKGLMLATAFMIAMFGAIGPAAAQSAVDVSEVVTEIGNAIGPVGQIGGAVLLVLVAIKVYKWVRRAF